MLRVSPSISGANESEPLDEAMVVLLGLLLLLSCAVEYIVPLGKCTTSYITTDLQCHVRARESKKFFYNIYRHNMTTCTQDKGSRKEKRKKKKKKKTEISPIYDLRNPLRKSILPKISTSTSDEIAQDLLFLAVWISHWSVVSEEEMQTDDRRASYMYKYYTYR